jgi:hypothetical protein
LKPFSIIVVPQLAVLGEPSALHLTFNRLAGSCGLFEIGIPAEPRIHASRAPFQGRNPFPLIGVAASARREASLEITSSA